MEPEDPIAALRKMADDFDDSRSGVAGAAGVADALRLIADALADLRGRSIAVCVHGRPLRPGTHCPDCGSHYRTIA